MTVKIYRTLTLAVLIACSCNNNKPKVRHDGEWLGLSPASESFREVANLYKSNCANCHKIDSSFIGPEGIGIASRVSFIWYKNFVRNPEILKSFGDPYIIKLRKKWKPTIMTSFPLLDDSTLYYLYAIQNNGALIDTSKRELTLPDNYIDSISKVHKIINNVKWDSIKSETIRSEKPSFRPFIRRTTNTREKLTQ